MFLDPFANLLRWSERLVELGLASLHALATDWKTRLGGIDAWRLTNAAQSGTDSGTQSVDAPGWYRYTFSVWVRSESRRRLVTLRLGSGSGAVVYGIDRFSRAGNAFAIPVNLGTDEEIRCAIELPAACAVDVLRSAIGSTA